MHIDTHRHYGGSITVDFVWKIIENNKLYSLAQTYDAVKRLMTFIPGESPGFYKFLQKFQILNHITWDEQTIYDSIKDVCQQFTAEQLDYVWLDLSIDKYMQLKWSHHQALQFIHDAFHDYYPNKVGLILSLKYESLQSNQIQYARLIDNHHIADLLIGIDLVGDEAQFDCDFYVPIFKNWNSARKITRAHVGESQSAQNIRDAITKLNVTNIAHGIKIVEDSELVDISKFHNITFDLAITSNYLTGVCPNLHHHPIKQMLDYGLNVTIGSDDPVQCSTTLANEFEIVKLIGVSDHKLIQTSIQNTNKFTTTSS